MGLRGVKAEETPQRFKVFFYGDAKIGKTTASIQFPKPYWIDTEGCADKPIYVKLLDQAGGMVFQTQDFEEVVKEVKELMTNKHEFKTLIIDSFTDIYDDLVARMEIKIGSDFGRHVSEANKRVKYLLGLLMRLDMNIIITCKSKKEYGDKMTVLGQTFDGYRKLNYFFDVIFEAQKRGKDRTVIVRGSRFECFKDGESFPFTYAEISSRYGREVMEKEVTPIKVADFKQVTELMSLIESNRIAPETLNKWLKKAKVETIEDMPYDDIQKCINHLKSMDQIKSKIQGEIA